MTKKSIFQLTGFFVTIVAAILALPHRAHAELRMPVTNNASVESTVKSFFADIPVMIAIAKCESGFRQFTSNGAPLRGGLGGSMIGVFQINEPVHAATAKKLGMDIYTLEGNLAYARYLHTHSGTGPWAPCVPDERLLAVPTAPVNMAATVPNATLTVNLSFGYSHPQVETLQKLLNAKGFTIAPSGPGSPGNETTKFGILTREALRRFQCSTGIACFGSETTTGYGRLGPMTRAALLK